MENQRYAEMAEVFEAILQQRPNHAQTVSALVKIYDAMGKKRVAQQYRARLDELKPLYLEQLKKSKGGRTLYATLQRHAALPPEELKDSLKNPDDWFYSTHDADLDDAEWLFYEAADSIMLDEIDVARKFLQIAFMIDPEVEQFLSVADNSVEPETVEAIVFWKLGLEFFPESGLLYSYLAATHLLRKEFAEAVSAYLEAIQLDPKDPDNYWRIAETYIKLGQFDDAEYYWKIVQKLNRKKADKLAYQISNARKGIRTDPLDLIP